MKYKELIDLNPEIQQIEDPLQKEELKGVLGLGIDFYWQGNDEIVEKIVKTIKYKLIHHKNETDKKMFTLLSPDADLSQEAQD